MKVTFFAGAIVGTTVLLVWVGCSGANEAGTDASEVTAIEIRFPDADTSLQETSGELISVDTAPTDGTADRDEATIAPGEDEISTISDPGRAWDCCIPEPDLGPADIAEVKPDVEPDAQADLIPDVTELDAMPDAKSDTQPDAKVDTTTAECGVPEDCQESHGPAGVCQFWDCADGACVKMEESAGTPCDDGDPCTTEDKCDGAGGCAGQPMDCDDQDACTEDSCKDGKCAHESLPPKPCTDEQGNPGFQECTGGSYGDCIPLPACDLKVNENDNGTVNPFIWPARAGLFYVSYVAHEDDGGNLKLVWTDPTACKVTAGPFNVNDEPGSVYYWGAQSVISDANGNFYAVWRAVDTSHVYFSASESGDVFGPAMDITTTSDNGLYPSIAALSPGRVAVAWTGYITADNPKGYEYDPFITTNQGVFTGQTFSQAVQVAATPIQDDSTAIAADDSGNIYVAWESFQDGTPEGGNIYVAKSTDGGKTFGDPVRVNDVPSKASVGIGTFMAWGGGRLYVVWSDSRNDYEGDVYLDSSEDGVTFGTDVLVNDDTYRYQEDPSVAVGRGTDCMGHVYVVWQDLRSNKSYDIYGAKSTDGGATFGANQVMTPSTDGDQMNPALTLDYSCTAGITWRDSSANPKFDVKVTFKHGW